MIWTLCCHLPVKTILAGNPQEMFAIILIGGIVKESARKSCKGIF
jgi:hypothetical protein